MAKTTRVHILAKELGVNSKAIVEKCKAEKLDVQNHMSTISAGLAATIREWFSEGEHSNTVESASRVDLKKVRVRKKAVPKKKEIEPATEVAEVVVVTEAPVIEEAPAGEPEQAQVASVAASVADESTSETKVEEKPAKPQTVKKPTVPKPKVIKPVGPMLGKPKPAKVTGPTVIRMEKIEPHEHGRRSPRSSGASGPPKSSGPSRSSRVKYDKPITEPLLSGTSIETPAKGKKGRDRTRGRRKETTVGPEIDVQKQKGGQDGQRRVRARDVEDRRARLAAAKGETLRARPTRRIEAKRLFEAQVSRPEKAFVSEPITVKDLSSALAVKASVIIEKLMSRGVMATANQAIVTDIAELIAMEMGTELIVERKKSIQEQIEKEFVDRENLHLEKRPPVVTMLGHVDHGKTSLLDKIRSTTVASGEAGGITQHIGAYQIDLGGKKVTFLDTPGHEAFTAMRARGANMTDIVVLVVAADDGLMPQSIEAIHHAKAADVEIIVALNKIDLPGVDINRIYGQLAEQELTPTEWGGKIEVVKTSAVTGEGIEDIIEHLDYMAELKDFKADSTVPAIGWVIEAKMTSTQGVAATVLLKEGHLKKGDIVLAGGGYGRVRSMRDSEGRSIKRAVSSMPVEITGLSEVPQAGDRFFCLADINLAKQAAEQNKTMSRERTLYQRSQVTLDNLFSQIESGNIKELNVILKADVQGSVDVLTKYIGDISTEKVKIRMLHAAVGGVNEGDVVLAHASGAVIIGFSVVADERVKEIAEARGVDIRLYNIIYRITEDLRDAMVGLLDPEYEEKIIGRCVVREIFKVSNVGTIAGCYVTSGSVNRKAHLRLIRGGIVVKDKCALVSLKHFKDDVREVKSGLECGIKIVGFDDIKVDDEFEVYEIIELARKL